MKEYIEREALLEAIDTEREELLAFAMFGSEHAVVHHARRFIEEAPAADVVSKAAFDQVLWERDVAIQQLREDYGVGLGEKKAADVVERKRGEWIKEVESKLDEHTGEYWEEEYCSCPFGGKGSDWRHNFCPNCGADMREVDHA